WLGMAANAGDADAAFALAYLYNNGRGVEKSTSEAMRWLDRAAALGHEEAKKVLAETLERNKALQKGRQTDFRGRRSHAQASALYVRCAAIGEYRPSSIRKSAPHSRPATAAKSTCRQPKWKWCSANAAEANRMPISGVR